MKSNALALPVLIVAHFTFFACESSAPNRDKDEFHDGGSGSKSRHNGDAAAESQKSEWTNSIGMRFRRVAAGDVQLEVQAEARSNLRRYRRPPSTTISKPARITRDYSISLCQVSPAQFRQLFPDVKTTSSRDDEQPVSVSWDQAADFCRRLSALPDEKAAGRSYRLPTLAEWLLSRPTSCWPRSPSVSHVEVRDWCQDIFDAEYYASLSDTEPNLDPAGAPGGAAHVSAISRGHSDPFTDIYTIRVVAVSIEKASH